MTERRVNGENKCGAEPESFSIGEVDNSPERKTQAAGKTTGFPGSLFCRRRGGFCLNKRTPRMEEACQIKPAGSGSARPCPATPKNTHEVRFRALF
jgi:hypothetical protein